MRLAIALYAVLWHLLMPVFFAYLWWRGKREPLYRQFWGERLGLEGPALPTVVRQRPLWVHCASLGELRGAQSIVKALLDQGQHIVLTTWTPAGRQAATTLFADAMAQQRLFCRYVPAEWSWAIARFIRHWKPACAMVTESEAWPLLLTTIRSHGVPLCKANAQYPSTSYQRDTAWGGFRSRLYSAYELVMCKSSRHAKRFQSIGCERVEVVGETRFEQTIPEHHLTQARRLRALPEFSGRPVVCFASTVTGEDETFLVAARRLKAVLGNPLIVYVPRSPQRFAEVAQLIRSAGLSVLQRSTWLDEQFNPKTSLDSKSVDVLLGDSLGEMYFYLEWAQAVVVGASFVDQGSHNVIEPLALHKPVWVGPSVWGIEFPGVEALEAGALQQAADGEDLAQQLIAVLSDAVVLAAAQRQAAAFFSEHSGATAKHIAVFLPWLQEREAP